MAVACLTLPHPRARELISPGGTTLTSYVLVVCMGRAVSQNVDYDTFKNMVAVAHLKPIHAANTAQSGGCGGVV